MPVTPVAAGTPERELERLALQERAHPDGSPMAVQAIVWLFRAYSAAMNELSAALRPLDLSPSAFNVLQSLANTPGQELEPCQLAHRLLVSRPSVTGLIDNLESKGLVARRDHPEDRRRVLVALTDRSRALLDAHYPDHYACLRKVTEGLSQEELETLVHLLRQIHGATPSDLAEAAPGTNAGGDAAAGAAAGTPASEQEAAAP